MDEILKVEKLTKTYKRGFIPKPVHALKDATFVVRRGQITGFIGANGAGKTTTLRCLLNFTHPNSGKFSFFGSDGFDMTARKKVGYLPEHPHFYSFLTGYELLKFYSDLSGQKKSRPELLKALDTVRLGEAADRPLSGYSKGMLQRAGLAQALIHQPELLILDEPMSGLDPDGRRLVRNILLEVAQKGVSLFFSTHLLDDAENLCDDLVLMAAGKVLYNGNLEGAYPKDAEKFTLNFQTASGETKNLEFKDRNALNAEIQQVLSQKGSIIEARILRPKLDDVFSRMSQTGQVG